MATVIQGNFRVRKNFAKITKIIDIPNLIDIQKQSYEKFLQKDLSPDQRLELIGECVLDGLRLEGKLDVPRLRRVLRVSERKSREVPRRRTLRGRLPRQAAGDEGHRRPRR